MVEKRDREAIVLAIHPKYAQAILDGTKTVEFRRGGVPEAISHIVLYSTSPVQKVVGLCEVGDCVVGSPTVLWQLFGAVGAISHAAFKEYYRGQEVGKCYILKKVHELASSLDLKTATGLDTPPRSFAFVGNGMVTSLITKEKKVSLAPSVPPRQPRSPRKRSNAPRPSLDAQLTMPHKSQA